MDDFCEERRCNALLKWVLDAKVAPRRLLEPSREAPGTLLGGPLDDFCEEQRCNALLKWVLDAKVAPRRAPKGAREAPREAERRPREA